MAAHVVPISRLFQRSWDWSPREIAEFYRVEAALLQAGLRIDTERGLSDDGDPWFVFCRHDDGEVIIHIARIDGEYVLVSPCYDGVARGRDISSMVRDLVSRHPLVHLPHNKSKPGSNVFLHPAVLLIAVVATAFFKHGEARAATADSDGGEAASARGMLTLGTSPLAPNGAPQALVTMDAAQSAVILSAIAAGLQSAPLTPDDELAAPGTPVTPEQTSDRAALSARFGEHDTHATLLPLTSADSGDWQDHGATALRMPLSTPKGGNALPLIAALWDLLRQPAETNSSHYSAGSAQDGAFPASNAAPAPFVGSAQDGAFPASNAARAPVVPTHSALTLNTGRTENSSGNMGQTESSSGNLPSVPSAQISSSGPDNTVQSHEVQHPTAVTLAPNASPSTNNFIVPDSVATTTTTATFAGSAALGIGAPKLAQAAAGTINIANLPASISTLLYVTRAAGEVTVNNGASGLTVNVNHNSPIAITPLAVNGPAGLSDSLSIILGDLGGTVGGIVGAAISFAPVGNGGGAVDGLTTTGYENVTISSVGPAGQGNVLAGVLLANVFSATLGAPIAVTLQGDTPLFTNALFVNGLSGTGVINDNLTSTLDIWAFGTNSSGASGPNIIATNAAAINGGGSGGVFMGGADSFFVGDTGDILTGSATKSNVLAGSIANDNLTGGSGTDFFFTDGGADTINLGAGHTGDHINLFFGNFAGNAGGFNRTVAGTFANATGLADSIIAPGDLAVAGSWGVAPAANPNGTPLASASTPFALFPHTTAANNGTSADMSVVNGFLGGDVVDISVGAWSRVALGNGLMTGNLTFPAGNILPPGAGGFDSNIVTVPAGEIAPAAATVIELQGNFADANHVALALGNNLASGGSTYNIFFSGAPFIYHSHFLALYNDTGNNARIADVDVTGLATASTLDQVVASDMVKLTGVSATALVNSNIHFVV